MIDMAALEGAPAPEPDLNAVFAEEAQAATQAAVASRPTDAVSPMMVAALGSTYQQVNELLGGLPYDAGELQGDVQAIPDNLFADLRALAGALQSVPTLADEGKRLDDALDTPGDAGAKTAIAVLSELAANPEALQALQAGPPGSMGEAPAPPQAAPPEGGVTDEMLAGF